MVNEEEMHVHIHDLGDYLEYLVEYDSDVIAVYLSGLTAEGFWEHMDFWEEVDNPENFAHGIVAGIKAAGRFAQAQPVDILAV